jgi:hypothetical protein
MDVLVPKIGGLETSIRRLSVLFPSLVFADRASMVLSSVRLVEADRVSGSLSIIALIITKN